MNVAGNKDQEVKAKMWNLAVPYRNRAEGDPTAIRMMYSGAFGYHDEFQREICRKTEEFLAIVLTDLVDISSARSNAHQKLDFRYKC